MLDLFAVAAPGLEGVVRDELRALGLAAEAEPGGARFRGPLAACLLANLESRAASRVLVRLAEFPAPGKRELSAGARRIPLDRFRAAGQAIAVKATCRASRLYHTGLVEETVAAALGAGGDAPPLELQARIVRDRCQISLDSSGELLHRRGHRAEGSRAPLRETLAAGMLMLAGWDPATPLCDPMCGSGTIALEGALMAMHRAPGLSRSFAFERWPGLDRVEWEALRAQAAARALPRPPAAILASDRHAGALAKARRNLERAGLAGMVELAQRDVAQAAPPLGAPPGLVITNPPYGRRLGDRREAAAAAAALGRALREKFRGWRAAIVAAHGEVERAIGLDPLHTERLVNGGIAVRLLVFEVG